MEVKLRTVKLLVKRLNSTVDADSVAEAIAEIRLLMKPDPESRPLLADAGAVTLLTAHLLPSGNFPVTQENAVAALLNISISTREALMSTPGLLDALTAPLGLPSSSAGAAQHATATLYSLLSVDEYWPIIGSKCPLVVALIVLLRAPNSPTHGVLRERRRLPEGGRG